MKVIIAMDSFKGSLTSIEAGEAVAIGIRRVYKDAETRIFPMADGGEGSTEAILYACGGQKRKARVKNPLGIRIEAEYGMIPDSQTAVIEMAAAAGLTLISEARRDPMVTTTYGVGELIKDAISHGSRKFIIGIGGSATNDGGIGMLSALGFQFSDADGNTVPYGAEGLGMIQEIKTDRVLPELSECSFSVICDVQNPLCGDMGCSAVYGPQKGADTKTVRTMDEAMKHFEAITRTVYPHADGTVPGSGAAGGLGFAFMTYLGGKLCSGIDFIIEQTALADKLPWADVVVTGEGRLDGQSQMGKTPVGVAKAAKRHGKPVLAFSGCVTADANGCNRHGIDAFFPIVKAPCSLAEAMDTDHAKINLSDTVEQAFRIIKYVRHQ